MSLRSATVGIQIRPSLVLVVVLVATIRDRCVPVSHDHARDDARWSSLLCRPVFDSEGCAVVGEKSVSHVYPKHPVVVPARHLVQKTVDIGEGFLEGPDATGAVTGTHSSVNRRQLGAAEPAKTVKRDLIRRVDREDMPGKLGCTVAVAALLGHKSHLVQREYIVRIVQKKVGYERFGLGETLLRKQASHSGADGIERVWASYLISVHFAHFCIGAPRRTDRTALSHSLGLAPPRRQAVVAMGA